MIREHVDSSVETSTEEKAETAFFRAMKRTHVQHILRKGDLYDCNKVF